jgi:hypothetical protein
MKRIMVDTPKGRYSIPAELVAKSRADYYEKKEPGVYQEEFDYTLGDDYELKDWLLNNMDWVDVEPDARKENDEVHVTQFDFFTSSDQLKVYDED